MRRLASSSGAALAAWLMPCREASAHALAQRYDLPLPLGLFLAGAGAVVVVSFVMLALFWRSKKSGLAYSDYTVAQGDVPTAVVLCLHIAGLGALMLVVLAGWFGNPSTF